ncbi:LysM domain-containing protein [Colletotrichum musicola]|uniref:LysM domain-containing protein n=1 Tax=Colletotrichum musicola TaxID=2175873 RepID=A0A8H6KD33_9PEZI|nr:LysM domain-containing protein [Colletotrichum musicola]
MRSFAAFTLLLAGGLLSPVAASRSARALQARDGPSPALPYAPGTSTYCSWWVDIRSSTTCDAIVKDNFITLEQLKRWNPSLAAACPAVEVGKSYCVEAFGEPEPTLPTTTSVPTSTASSTRTSTSTTSTTSPQPPTTTTQPPTTTTTAPGNGITTPTPTQATIVDNCDAFYFVVAGDSCDSIASRHGITTAQFRTWNPSVGDVCAGLWANAYACVSIIGHTPSPTTPGNGITTPTPTQATIVNNCDAFYYVVAGDNCETIASKHGITVAQFQAWNPSAGATCSGLWANAYACVSIIGHTPGNPPPAATTTTAGNGIATPTPVQPGMVGNCDAFYKVKAGDTCDGIASSSGVTAQQITTWNPAVKADCTALWLEYYMCVSVVGHTPTQPGNGIQTPSPIQSGMTTSCKSFHFVTPGQNCEAITARYGISQANFVRWNPAVKADCTGMWANAYVCVAVL